MKAIWDLDDLTRITRRREFEDGLVDLLNAVVYLIVGLLTASVYSASSLRWYLRMLAVYPEVTVVCILALVPLLAVLIVCSRRTIDRIRRNTFRPARGYVKPQHEVDWHTRVPALIIVMIWASIGFWGTLRGWLPPDSDIRFLVSGIGVAAGVVYFGKGLILKFPRYIVVGGIGGLMSIAFMIIPFSVSTSWAVLSIFWSTLLLLSGFIGLRTTFQMMGRTDNG